MTNYFKGCSTAEQVKRAYYQYAKKLHPDNGGSEAAFKDLQAQFEKAFERLKNTHASASGQTYTRTGEQATAESAGNFMELIRILLTLDGIQVELCGSWLWISGNTRPHADTLKSCGCRWSRNKKMWYHNGGDWRPRHRRKAWSIDRIRSTYGSIQYEQAEEKKKITA